MTTRLVTFRKIRHPTPGEVIRFHRKRRGLSQADLAYHLGTSPSFLSMLETGSRIPSEFMAHNIETALGITRSHALRRSLSTHPAWIKKTP